MNMFKESSWENIRQKGRWHFIWTRGILGFGVFMYILEVGPTILFYAVKSTGFYYVVVAIVDAVLGALAAAFLWYIYEKRYQKKILSH